MIELTPTPAIADPVEAALRNNNNYQAALRRVRRQVPDGVLPEPDPNDDGSMCGFLASVHAIWSFFCNLLHPGLFNARSSDLSCRSSQSSGGVRRDQPTAARNAVELDGGEARQQRSRPPGAHAHSDRRRQEAQV